MLGDSEDADDVDNVDNVDEVDEVDEGDDDDVDDEVADPLDLGDTSSLGSLIVILEQFCISLVVIALGCIMWPVDLRANWRPPALKNAADLGFPSGRWSVGPGLAVDFLAVCLKRIEVPWFIFIIVSSIELGCVLSRPLYLLLMGRPMDLCGLM